MSKWGMGVRRCMTAALMVVGAALSASPASAEWREARARHFILYGNISESDIRAMATRLEQFDAVLRYFFALPEIEGQESNPVTVYVVPNGAAVRRLYGKGSDNVLGFYQPRVSGSVAFTPMRGEGDNPNDMQPQQVLFHEYAHHFLVGNSSSAYPAWFSEGFAEFTGTAKFDRTGVMVGVAAQHRAYGLLMASKLPIETLFDSSRRKLDSMQLEQVYGRGWLLTHLTMFDPAQKARLGQYFKLLNTGTPSIQAGNQAFGSLKDLDRDLDRYLRRGTIPGVLVPFDRLGTPQVAVRVLSPGEQALIGYRMQSDRGVDDKAGRDLYARAASAAASYPQDAVAQGWFAEMAYDAGEDAAGEAAADRALAVDAKSQQALLYKGLIHLRRVETAKSRDPKLWEEARSWIVKANRADPNAAEPLAVFYRSFMMQGEKPRASAIAGLGRAFELVPQDGGLRMMLVMQKVREGAIDNAKALLRPLAFNPHLSADNPAAQMLTVLESGNQEAIRILAGPSPASTAAP